MRNNDIKIYPEKFGYFSGNNYSLKKLNFMKTKKELLSSFEDGDFYYFVESLENNFKTSLISGECDSKTLSIILKKEEYKSVFPYYPVCNFDFYQSFRCCCDRDCCGCISSISANIKKIGDYICIIIRYSYNY